VISLEALVVDDSEIDGSGVTDDVSVGDLDKEMLAENDFDCDGIDETVSVCDAL